MGVLLNYGITTINNGMQYEDTLESSKETLNSLTPIVKQIKELYMKSDRPIEEVQRLENVMKEGQELVDMCSSSSSSKWSCLRFLFYPCKQSKLMKKDAHLRRHFSLDVAAQNKRDMMEIWVTLKEILDDLRNRTEFFGQNQIRGLRGAPPEPECIGMDQPLNRLRINLLNNDVPVLVLTGLGGSGKSTLAKKICWDPQIKDKLGANIFFFNVSKTPNLMNIVGSLFKHCGSPEPRFQSDEDAANQLGVLLNHVGKNPTLLVFDDVWPSSETLVEKFIIKIPNYKILVTSRYELPRFGSPYRLDKLDHKDALAIFRYNTQLNEQSSYIPDKKRVDEIVNCCKGSPLALEVIGGRLHRQPFEVWQDMENRLKRESILELDTKDDLLCRLQQSVDMCSMNEKLCFMVLRLFPEGQRIPATALTDMWSELSELDENDINAMAIVHDLTTRNLINVIVTRKVGKDEDMYYNNHFIMLHDVLGELAIRQSKDKPIEKKERLSIDLYGHSRPKWWVGRNQQGNIGRAVSFILGQKLRVAARILSISTDEMFTSDWCDMLPDKAEVLILNHRSSQYSLPEFTKMMRKLKVLIVTNYGFHRSELNKFELLSCLSNLKRIRLEKVSVPSLCILKNLQKLSLHMCTTNQAFESGSIKISDAMPNLVEMNIEYCKDLVKLPDELCNITTLEKLSITNYHRLSSLPQDITKLENLEVLRLCSCSNLVEMPNSVTGLDKVNCIDFSDCVSLAKLPDDICKMKKLDKLYLKGCSKLLELPDSVVDFRNLNHTIYVICDEETAALWENFHTIPNLNMEISKKEHNLNWLHPVHS